MDPDQVRQIMSSLILKDFCKKIILTKIKSKKKEHVKLHTIPRYFCCYSKYTFSKNSFGTSITLSNGLDSDQDWNAGGPDLGPNCLQRLSSENCCKQGENYINLEISGLSKVFKVLFS